MGEHTLSAGGATGLDLPHVVLGYSVEVEGLCYVVRSHGCAMKVNILFSFVPMLRKAIGAVLTSVNILLVGENEQHDVAHFAVLDDAAEFGLGLLHARAVAGVNDEN